MDCTLLEQRFCHRRVMLLTGREGEGERASFAIHAGMDFRRQPTATPS